MAVIISVIISLPLLNLQIAARWSCFTWPIPLFLEGIILGFTYRVAARKMLRSDNKIAQNCAAVDSGLEAEPVEAIWTKSCMVF